ncbi:nucleophile aminohydrolase, partial [Lentinula edodes]
LLLSSPNGHLFQVCGPRQCHISAVRKGTQTRINWKKVGVRGKDVVVLGVEKKSVLQLQDPRTVRKLAMLDDQVCLAFADLTADGRVLIDKAQIECHSHSTQSGGGPFHISTFIVGFDPHDTKPHLHMTEPSGICSAWKVIIIFISALFQTYILTLPI